ncbi:uncharacterized protein [Dendrobates tinctorius]|uniref:uncharacterized protein isoform X2 n=1 Tax=Dendrobates tinctorius TaxID=92724 RepID=UPI003CCA4D36
MWSLLELQGETGLGALNLSAGTQSAFFNGSTGMKGQKPGTQNRKLYGIQRRLLPACGEACLRGAQSLLSLPVDLCCAERPPRPKSAKKIRSRMTQRILNITLEIIYLLTGEDYTVVKSRKRAKMRELGELDRPQTPTAMTPPPPCHSNDENNDRQILELAYKIIQLLNGEEGDYLEGHHDFYADMLNNEQSFSSHDINELGLVIDTSDTKEESMLYEEGTLMDTSIYTSDGHHSYISTRHTDELISQEEEEEEKLTDTDVTCTLVKEEPPSCDAETLTDKYVWEFIDHRQQDSSAPVQDEEALRVKSNKLNNSAFAPICHRQAVDESCIEKRLPKPFSHFKNKSISCKDGHHKALSKEKVHDPDGEVEYRLVRIKDDSSSEDDITSTEEFLKNDVDMQKDNIVTVNLTQQDKPINPETLSPNNAIKIYQCVGCQKHFTTKIDLQTHQTIHKTFQMSICPECGKTFLCTSALITHRQSHTGENPFLCTVCGKLFGQLSQLKTHERIHTNEKPFSCLVCGKSFRCRSHLMSHARIHKEVNISVV